MTEYIHIQAPSNQLVIENQKLRAFVKEIFEISDWPEGGDIDQFDFQDAMIKHGILVPEHRTKACAEEGCFCSEYHGEQEMEKGITCYRMAEWLK